MRLETPAECRRAAWESAEVWFRARLADALQAMRECPEKLTYDDDGLAILSEAFGDVLVRMGLDINPTTVCITRDGSVSARARREVRVTTLAIDAVPASAWCKTCEGTGVVVDMMGGSMAVQVPCPDCT
jgi:hypothetical protein